MANKKTSAYYVAKTAKKSSPKKEVEIEAGEFDIKKSKVRITCYLDFSNITNLKKEAIAKNIGYQTLLNEIISNHYEHSSEKEIKIEIDLIKRAIKEIKESVNPKRKKIA